MAMTILVIFGIVVLAGELIELVLIFRRHTAAKRISRVFRDCAAEPAYADTTQLSALPEPVKRYLLKALPESLRIIRAVRLQCRGHNLSKKHNKWKKSSAGNIVIL